MKFGLYPGCSLEASSREYLESLRAIAPKLGLEFEEVKNWNCCGASSAHAIDHLFSVALPATILAQAEQQQLKDLVVPCAACYSRLAIAKIELTENAKVRNELQAKYHLSYTGTTNILTILDVLERVITPEVSKQLPKRFTKNVVCYYGCLLVRPQRITNVQRVEDPQQMEEIVKTIGAHPLPWGMKTECCGASFSITRTELVGKLCGRVLDDAVCRGAEAIIVACPMCHSNLDMRRSVIEHVTGKKYTIPVLFITQVIGFALGLTPAQLGMTRHFVSTESIVSTSV
ncbi:MAG: CoB--CoM heterodisulfide reductase iron-sulfur subunit B family protein [Bacteroidetes bacterium]|nr:CoB--CoM heterodisulfide reductase iron-sulfur subunit B family protein [Bacteroidota bacterium]